VCASMKNRVRVSGTGFSNEASIRGGVSHPSITPGRASKEKSVNLELF
jgi:hypothetical protein